MRSVPRLLFQIESVARLNVIIFLFRRQLEFVITQGISLVRSEAQAVLIAQFLFNAGVNFVESLFLGRALKHTAAGFLRDSLQDFFAIRALFLRLSPPSAAATSAATAHGTSHAGIAKSAAMLSEIFFAFEIDGVNESIRTLGGFNRALQRLFAAAIDAIGDNDQSFATFLLFHQFIRGKINRVIERGSAPMHSPASSLAP